MGGGSEVIAGRLLSTQRAINAHLAALKPAEELVPGVIQSVCETLDWSFGSFWVPTDEEARVLEVRAIWHQPSPRLEAFGEHCRETRFRPGEGLLGTILDTREPAWLRNVQATPLPRSGMAVPDCLRSVFGFPLAIDNRFHGILEFICEEERDPEPELIRDFQVVGAQLALYLDRREAHAALARREEEARVVVNSLAEGVVVMDAGGRATMFNDAAQRMLRVDPEDVRGRSGRIANADAVYLEDGTRLGDRNTLVDHVLATREPVERALLRVEQGGESRWFEVNIQPLPGGGLVASFSDVTERREAESQQRRLAAIVASSDEAILSKDRNRVIQSWNVGAERLYGWTAEEAVGQKISMVIPPERRGEEREILDRVVYEGGVSRYETQRMRKDGSLVDIALTASPIVDSAGQVVGASVIARDITIRKDAERALREERDRAECYLDMAHSVIVAIGHDERPTMINRTGLEILGRSEEEVLASNWFDLVLPDDVREGSRSRFRELIEGRHIDEDALNYSEIPLLTADGDKRTVAWKTTLMRDSRGGISGVLTSGTAITERLKSQQAKEWRKHSLDISIHFNLSPRQLRHSGSVDAIRNVIEQDEVPVGMLTAEITESAAMAEAEMGHSMLAELRELGIHLSVDDFGSGYSSLGRLRHLPVDELKLDRSFLRGVPHDPEAGALVRGVIELANGLGMNTVVEGVETPAQWEFLSAHGRLLAQGFHLARPAPAEDITLMLESAHQAA